MTATEINQNDALAAWPIRGLARRFPAKDLATLKTLLQEFWHNRQTGIAALNKLTSAHPVRRLAETLNQAVARLTYPAFVARLGGQSTHQRLGLPVEERLEMAGAFAASEE